MLRRFLFSFALVLLAVFPVLQGRAQESKEKEETVNAKGWTVYHNPRFGFDLPVPPAMSKKRAPDNGGGRSYFSKDEKFSVAAWAHFNVEASITGLEAEWKQALEQEGRKITYKTKGKTWFVVSGVNDNGFGFYHKFFVEGDYCAAFSITYPQAQEKEFQPAIEKIAKEFKANLGKGVDNLEPEKSTAPAKKRK